MADPVSTFDASLFDDACSLGPVPIDLTKVFRRFLTNVFRAGNLENQHPAVQRMVWTGSPATSGIAIEDAGGWTPELTEKRPAVIIKRGDWTTLHVSIDDRCLPDAGDGHRYHGNFLQGSHTMMCITGSSPETELLLAEVYRQLNQFGPALRKKLQLKRFQVTKAGEQMILEQEGRENFVASVGVAYVCEEFWQLKDLSSPVLTGVQLGLAQQS